MKSAFKTQKGITLIEIILVLMIGSAILLMSMQQYLAYRRDSDMMQLRANVDTLFHGLANYFRANCNSDSSQMKNYWFGTSLAVDMATLKPYLANSITPNNPLVKSSGPGGGYIVQFNQYHISSGSVPLPQRTVRMSTSSGGGTANVGYINAWQAQVAVNIANASQATTYKNALGADCVSATMSGWGGQIVQPCQNEVAGTDWLVWTRSPSLASSRANSDFWMMMPLVKTFSQMYQTDPILVLTDQTQTASQYYRCGS